MQSGKQRTKKFCSGAEEKHSEIFKNVFFIHKIILDTSSPFSTTLEKYDDLKLLKSS